MRRQLFSDRNALSVLCRRHHIRRLSLFGSTLEDSARPASDVDLLVEFEAGLLRRAGIEAELSRLLGGREADLRTPHDLSRHFRDEVLATAKDQFESR